MKYSVIIFLLAFSLASAQEYTQAKLDSLFNLYVKIKSVPASEAPLNEDTSVTKCGFGVVNFVRNNYSKYNPARQQVLRKLFSRPVTQTSRLSPSGLFRVNYDTSGVQSIKYDINLLLEAADSSYNFEVIRLGYLPPHGSTDPNNKVYDIYVINAGGLYGYTEIEDNLTNHTYSTFIVMDNDYASMNTKGINGARVTIAHELHHAIQLGNYAYNENDIYFHELSSTAMEEFVFDSINDYYYYMHEYFTSPDITFSSHSGYDLAIWNIYLADIFNIEILRRQWEILYGKKALEAIVISIGEKGTNFQDVFNKFGVWVYYTNYRKIPGKYFSEGDRYPAVDYIFESPISSPIDSIHINAQPVTHNFYTFTNEVSNNQFDTLTVLVSNSDYLQANIDPGQFEPALYELSTDSTSELDKLIEGYYRRLTASNPAFWVTSEFLNNQLISEGFVRIEGTSPFPVPFKYSKNSFIYFPVHTGGENEVLLNIYSTSMDLVYSSKKDIFMMFGKDLISWDGKNEDNRRLGTGVYIYVIKSGDNYLKGKIVLFND